MPVRSFNADDDVSEFLDRRENISRFINRVISRVKDGYDPEVVILDYKIEDLSGEIAELERQYTAQLDAKRERLQELKDRRGRLKREEETERERVIDDFARDVPDDFPLNPSEPTVQAKAEQADVAPEEFIEAVERRRSA